MGVKMHTGLGQTSGSVVRRHNQSPSVSPDEVRRLIAEVKARPLIWDQRLPEHGDATKTRLAWKAIASKLGGYTPEEWRKVWKNKRDYYNCSTRRGTSSTNWPYARLLTFLDPVLGHRQPQCATTSILHTQTSQNVTAPTVPVFKDLDTVNLRLMFNRSAEPGLEMLAFGKYVALSLSAMDEKSKNSAIFQIQALLVNHLKHSTTAS